MHQNTNVLNLSEIMVAENVDEILRRSALRLEQERIHVRELHQDSRERNAAEAALTSSVASHDKLKAYRLRLRQAEHPSPQAVVSKTRQKDKAQ
jgi:hypothetical protein